MTTCVTATDHPKVQEAIDQLQDAFEAYALEGGWTITQVVLSVTLSATDQQQSNVLATGCFCDNCRDRLLMHLAQAVDRQATQTSAGACSVLH